MSRKAVQQVAEELRHWFSNMDRESIDVFWRVLASLPGGDEAEGIGYEPLPGFGWKESELLEEMLAALDDKGDVEELVAMLLDDGQDEGDDD